MPNAHVLNRNRPRRWSAVLAVAGVALLLAGCPKGGREFKAGRQAEALKDFESALAYYEAALRADPRNTEYKLKVARTRFEAGQSHVTRGQKLREQGELQQARAAFEKAVTLDPSSPIARQELIRTLEMLHEAAPREAPPPAAEETRLEGPPALKPISRDPINLRLTEDGRRVYETIAKLAGLTVIFDPDLTTRRIPVELTNVTLEEALDVVALQTKTFWKPVTSNIIMVVGDTAQKRQELADQVVRTFYMSNTLQAQDLTEIVTGLRQVVELTRVQQVNAQNAIVVRDTPDKVLLAEKILRDIDRAKPEVVIQVSVMQARRDRARELGITPGSSATLNFTPRGTSGTGTGTGTGGSAAAPSISLDELQRLSSADYSISLPGALAQALATDSSTRIIQNPEIRTVDGMPAKLRIGDRVPVATGSFQAGIGVGGAVGGVAAGVNPLVNTQFQYLEVGVNIDITPRIHSSREISMRVTIEVSSVTGRVDIGGIQQPIISQRKIEHDIRLREGEASILGGIIEQSDVKSISGWPGLAKVPFFRYFFSGERVESAESEVFIVLTPRIIRLPEISPENLRTVLAGSQSNVRVRTAQPEVTPVSAPPAAAPPAAPPAAARETPPAEPAPAAARLRFDPAALQMKPGETQTIALVVENVTDLFSIPLILQYDPKVIAVEDVRHGGFLSGGTQEIAIVQQILGDRGQAVVSAARQPNTTGVSGTGTFIGVVVRAVGPGTARLSVVQVNARNSQQQPIPVVTQEAVIEVRP